MKKYVFRYSDMVWRPVSTLDCKKVFCQGNTQDDYLEEICAIQRPKCGFMGCEYPLTVRLFNTRNTNVFYTTLKANKLLYI